MLRKRILVSLFAATAMATAAHAADLPMRSPLLAPPAVFTWTGFYVGVNAGGSFSNSNRSNYTYVDPNECGNAGCTIPSTTTFGAGSSQNGSGFIGGGQIGYNWQMSSVVLGLEADFDFANRTKQSGFFARKNCEITGCAAGPDGFDHFLSSGSGGGDFGTFRGRLGWAMDHTLLYVTGGLAWGEGSNKTTVKDYRLLPGSTQLASYAGIPVDTFYSNGSGGTSVGFAVGAGLEYALSPNWSVKAEYLYVSLDGAGNQRLLEGSGPDFGPAPGNIGTLTSNNKRDSFSVARVGLNYKFGG